MTKADIDNLKIGSVIKVKSIRELPFDIKINLDTETQRVMQEWLGVEMTIKDITTYLGGETVFMVNENSNIWNSYWVSGITDQNQTQNNTTGNEMTKIKTVMKHIRTKVALNEELNANEYNLVQLAGKSYLKNDRLQVLSSTSWNIKFQDALANIKDLEGNIIPYYYFQLLSCNLGSRTDGNFKWISDEIIKLMLDNMDGENNYHILFSSNNLNITVDIKRQRLVMQRAIRRGREHTIENTKVYTYDYTLENLSWFADDLIQASK